MMLAPERVQWVRTPENEAIAGENTNEYKKRIK